MIDDLLRKIEEAIKGFFADSLISSMRGELMSMELYEVVAMWAEAQVIGAMVWVISLVIMVILFGRMLEIYLYISVAPLPFAAFGNRELSGMSQNYVKGLAAVAFQGFFIMVVVGIYSKLVATVGSGSWAFPLRPVGQHLRGNADGNGTIPGGYGFSHENEIFPFLQSAGGCRPVQRSRRHQDGGSAKSSPA